MLIPAIHDHGDMTAPPENPAESPRELLRGWLARTGRVAEEPLGETHVSILACTPDRVYKLKKPVRFAFVDLSTAAKRRENCEREVTLNRRLAPDVYLGVVDVTDSEGVVRDAAVEMRRLPAARRLSTLVGSGRDATGCIDGLAASLAAFHARAARSPAIDRDASAAVVASLWERGIAEVREFEGDVVDRATALQVADLARRYVAGRERLFAARIAAGRACDGHGDLLADDVFCLEDGPRALDCLEFDARLRAGDGLADAAFLAMDLERLGRRDLAGRFLDRYRDAAGDAWPPSLAHHYVAYRAHVRTKVACLRHRQGDSGSAGEARQLLALALDRLERARVRLVLVGGPPATGKTTLALGLGERTGWAVLHSDVVRKQLAGVEGCRADAPLDTGIYAPQWTARTYEALVARAAEQLELGCSVVLDASWAAPEWRELARAAAARTHSDVVALRCLAPVEVARARAAGRARAGTDASDASSDIAGAVAARFAAWPDAFELDATLPAADVVRRALDRVGPH
jgi:hypothetical protein